MATFAYQMFLTDDPDGGVDVSFPDLPGCLSFGDDWHEAIEMGIDAARTWVAAVMADGGHVPAATFHDTPAGARSVWVGFDASPDYIVDGAVMSATEAARTLGVSRGRVTHMLDSGRLDGYRDGRRTWVTVDSVNARLEDGHRAGRPRKEPITA